MIDTQSYQAIFDKGVVGSSLDGFRNSELATQSAKELLNFYISEMGTLRVAKQYKELSLIPQPKSGEYVISRMNTKYSFFIIFTQSRIITINKTTLAKIKEINVSGGSNVLNETCNINVFNDFIFVKDINKNVYVFAFSSNGNLGTANFFDTIKLPFQNKKDVAMDIYKCFKYGSEIRPELMTTYTKDAELKTDFSGAIYLKNSGIKIDRVYVQYKSLISKDQITGATEGLTFAVLKSYQEPSNDLKYYLDNSPISFGGKTTDSKYGGFYFTTATASKSGKLIFGVLENFLADKKKIVDIVEFQSRLAIATEDKLYCSKILDYNDFVPDLTDDAGFFIKPAIIDNNQPNIMKLVAGNGLYIVCSDGIMVAAYNSILSGLSSSNIKIAGDTQPTHLTALIEDIFYYVDKNGTLRAIVPNFSTGIIMFANIIVEKYDYTRNNIKYIYKGNINEDNILIVVPKDRKIIKVYTSLPDNMFRYFNIEFSNSYPVFGYGNDLISGQKYYKLTQKNMSDAKIVLNMPFIQTKDQGIYLNDFKATYRRLVLNVYAPTRNDIKGITINKEPIQNLGTDNYGNFNIYDFMKTISIIDTTIDIKTNQTEETIEVRGINGFIK